ncbi:FAD-dependent monooxygenase [Lichenihabitans sp. Uapishka_5]|uniref:FAD-dependent monooxygenase n=1 Tax=Lichenihabitans sp. Uapishka_5 TaxID=3037302 RepID=UPI0029E7EC77|nr:FAD-dependent monooxygenase [Lichenihabitans sp. Uapishka_5]MDX7949927.1 FAD-dependent monooxygenase [Lichenihabitans sp. Uapishka_5]
MPTTVVQHDLEAPVVVVGAGAVGLTAAIALARQGRAVTLVGQPGAPRPGRTVALLEGSVDLLRQLDLWPSIAPAAEALRTMRIVDATGSLFAPPPVAFKAEEIGLSAFGYNVDNATLEAALWQAAGTTSGLTLASSAATGFAFKADAADVRLDTGEVLRASLVVAADGRASLARKAAHIGVRTTEHPQRAMTATFAHAAPHGNVSTEFHTREGPFTLVPLPGEGQRRSSLVWVMSPAAARRRRAAGDAAFVRDAERQCARLLGAMTLEGAIGSFPIITQAATALIGPRLVLVGEAAHALPPIGAQGLNLSFRDVAALVRHVAGTPPVADPGNAEILRAFERERRRDVAGRIAAVDLLNGSLLSRGVATDALRGAGLMALGRVAPVRRFLMRHGLAPGTGRSVRPSA